MTDAADVSPEIDERGELRFVSLPSLRAALPRLRRGAISARGTPPPVGAARFRLKLEGSDLEATCEGKVVTHAGGRALIMLHDVPESFLRAVETMPEVSPSTKSPTSASVKVGIIRAVRSAPTVDVLGGSDEPVALPGSVAPREAAVALPGARTQQQTDGSQYVGRAAQSLDVVAGPSGPAAVRAHDDGRAALEEMEFNADISVEERASAGALPVGDPLLAGVPLDGAGPLPMFLACGARKVSGALKLTKGSVTKIAVFCAGRVVELRSNDPTELLGEVLAAAGIVSNEQVQKALEQSREAGIHVGLALVRQGALSDGELRTHLRHQVRARLADVFSWSHGAAQLDPGAAVPEKARALPMTTVQLCRLFTTSERGISPARIMAWLKPDARVARADASAWMIAPGALTDVEQRVMQALDKEERVTDLVARLQGTAGSEDQIMHALHMLVSAQCLRIVAQRAAEPAVSDDTDTARAMELESLAARLGEHDVFRILGMHANTPTPQLLEGIDALAARVNELTQGLPPGDTTRSTLMARISEHFKRVSDPLERRIMARAHMLGVDATEPNTRAMLENDCVGQVVASFVAEGKYSELGVYAERALTMAPTDPLAIAAVHLGRAFALSADAPARLAALEALRSASQKSQRSVVLHLAVAEVALLLGKRQDARNALAAVELLDPSNVRARRLSTVLARGAHDGTRGLERPASPLRVLAMLGFVVVALGGLGVMAVLRGMGEREHLLDVNDRFAFIRAGALLAISVVGSLIAFSRGPVGFLRDLKFWTTPDWVVVAVLLGGAGGLLAPRPAVVGAAAGALGLTIVRVLSEQVLFTGLVTRALTRAFPRAVAILVGGALFGLYQLTFHAVVRQGVSTLLPVRIALVVVGSGIPYALLYVFPRSMLPPLVCQLTGSLLALGLAVSGP